MIKLTIIALAIWAVAIITEAIITERRMRSLMDKTCESCEHFCKENICEVRGARTYGAWKACWYWRKR